MGPLKKKKNLGYVLSYLKGIQVVGKKNVSFPTSY